VIWAAPSCGYLLLHESLLQRQLAAVAGAASRMQGVSVEQDKRAVGAAAEEAALDGALHGLPSQGYAEGLAAEVGPRAEGRPPGRGY
jgi:hypothetical protein